jgi:hypothetical protein
MNLVTDGNTRSLFLIALFPCLLTVLLILSQVFTAYGFNASIASDFVRMHFVSGLLMSFGSGYLWLCLKFNNINLVSALISLLIKTNQLSELRLKRKHLRARYKLDAFNALVVSFILVTLLVFIENLLVVPPTVYQYAYLVNAVIFFFILGFAIVQISSNLNYLNQDVLVSTSNEIDHLNGAFIIIKFGISNISKLIYLALLMPLIYLNRTMMISELAIVSAFLIFAASGPIRKTWELFSVWSKDKKRISDKFDETRYSDRNIAGAYDTVTFETYGEISSISARELLEVKKYVAGLSLILLLWLVVHIYK